MTQHARPAVQISILILAAGASSRMRGADKLLETVRGTALLRHLAQLARATGLPVVVALAKTQPGRTAALEGLAVQPIWVGDAGSGMAVSLREGVSAIPQDHAVLVLLADMPDIDAVDLATVIAAYRLAPDHIHRACTATGTLGHPVVFPPWARADLLGLAGDSGARALLQAHASSIVQVPLPGTHATTDLDTPEDWAAWRSTQNKATPD